MIINVFDSHTFIYSQLGVTVEAASFCYDANDIFLSLLLSDRESVQNINGFARDLIDWLHDNRFQYSIMTKPEVKSVHSYDGNLLTVKYVQGMVGFNLRIRDPEAQLLYKLTFGTDRVVED